MKIVDKNLSNLNSLLSPKNTWWRSPSKYVKYLSLLFISSNIWIPFSIGTTWSLLLCKTKALQVIFLIHELYSLTNLVNSKKKGIFVWITLVNNSKKSL